MGKGCKGKGKGEYNIKQLTGCVKSSGVLPGGVKWENDEKTVFITGLPEDTTDLDVYKLFAPFGAIALNGAIAFKDKENKEKCKGVAAVNYLELAAAENCVYCMNNHPMPDGISTLRVMQFDPSREQNRK